MIRFTPEHARRGRLVRAALTLAAVGALAGLSACAPKITNVNATYMPEGVVSPKASLIVWSDEPTLTYVYHDSVPADPDSTDRLLATEPFQRYTAGVVQGMILDNTQADAFQMFRREPGGGMRQFTNYPAPRTRQWLATQYETYHFADLSPSSFRPGTYLCRGVIDGIVNNNSPLTNQAQLTDPPVTNIAAKAIWYPPNGKIKLTWTSVPGAARYLIHAYDFRADLRDAGERILSGTLSPFYDGESTDLYFAIAPANVNFMFVGDSTRNDLTTIAIKPIASGSAVMIRVTALDATGHIIGMTFGDPNPIRAGDNGEMGIVRNVRGNNTYRLYRLGATTSRDTVGHGGGNPGGGLG